MARNTGAGHRIGAVKGGPPKRIVLNAARPVVPLRLRSIEERKAYLVDRMAEADLEMPDAPTWLGWVAMARLIKMDEKESVVNGERFTKLLPETPQGTKVTITGYVAGRSDTVDQATGARNARVTVVDASGRGIWTSEVPEAALVRAEDADAPQAAD